MNKYIVTVHEVHSYNITVEAEDEISAKELVHELIEVNEYTAEYDYTVQYDEWPCSIVRQQGGA